MAKVVQNEILPLNFLWMKSSKFPPLLSRSFILPNSCMRASLTNGPRTTHFYDLFWVLPLNVGPPEFVQFLSMSRFCPIYALISSSLCPAFVMVLSLSRFCPQSPSFVLSTSAFCPKHFTKSNVCPTYVFITDGNPWQNHWTIYGLFLDANIFT